MTDLRSYFTVRTLIAAALAIAAPVAGLGMAAIELRGAEWRRRLGQWSAAAFSRAVALPTVVAVVLLSLAVRAGGPTRLSFWWLVGCTAFAGGLALALTVAWLRWGARPPEAEGDHGDDLLNDEA